MEDAAQEGGALRISTNWEEAPGPVTAEVITKDGTSAAVEWETLMKQIAVSMKLKKITPARILSLLADFEGAHPSFFRHDTSHLLREHLQESTRVGEPGPDFSPFKASSSQLDVALGRTTSSAPHEKKTTVC